MFDDGVDAFKNLSLNFMDFIDAANDYSYMFNVSRIGLGFDYDHELFEPNFFIEVDKTSLERKQDSVIEYMTDARDNFTRIFELFYAQRAFYSLANQFYYNGSEVEAAFKTIQLSLLEKANQDIVAFSAGLLARDVVCFIAMAHEQVQDVYDYYDLSEMSDRNCNLTEDEWLVVYNTAYTARIEALLPVEVQVCFPFSIFS